MMAASLNGSGLVAAVWIGCELIQLWIKKRMLACDGGCVSELLNSCYHVHTVFSLTSQQQPLFIFYVFANSQYFLHFCNIFLKMIERCELQWSCNKYA